MMKTDQLEKQCRDDAQRIRRLTDENQTKFDEIKLKISTIDTEKKEKLDSIGSDFQTWKTNEIPKLKEDYRGMVDAEVKAFNATKEKKLKELSAEWEELAKSAVEGVKTDSKKKIEDVEREATQKITDTVDKAKKQVGIEIVSLIEEKEAQLNRLIADYQRKIDALPAPIDLQENFANEEEDDGHEASPEAPVANIYDDPSDGEEPVNPTSNA